MDPTTLPIPRKVKLRPGRIQAPAFVGYLLNFSMLVLLYELVRPLWVMFCLCTNNKKFDAVPIPPWDGWMGLSPKDPVTVLFHIVVVGVLLVALRAAAQKLVWEGLREKDYLRRGRALTATVTRLHPDQNGRAKVTYSYTCDGQTVQKEALWPTALGRPELNKSLVVLLSFDSKTEMLYDEIRWQV